MAGSELRLLNLATSHDRDEEDKGDGLEYHVDKGEEESEGADVLEGLPWVGVLEGLAGPDLAHNEDPEDVHHDGHNRQQHQLFEK